MTGETDRRAPDRLQQQKMLSELTRQGEDCLRNLSVCLWCLSLFYQFISQPVRLRLLLICLYTSQHVCMFIFLLLSLWLFISPPRGSFEVTKLSNLVISGCHHKRLRATSLNGQKGPCIPTKKPLLCNALMLPLLMLLLTMIESRGKKDRGEEKIRGGVGER